MLPCTEKLFFVRADTQTQKLCERAALFECERGRFNGTERRRKKPQRVDSTRQFKEKKKGIVLQTGSLGGDVPAMKFSCEESLSEEGGRQL